MTKSAYSVQKRQTWASILANIIAPGGSGLTLSAIVKALPALADISDAAFSKECARAIGPKCTACPDAAELRNAILGHLAGTRSAGLPARQTGPIPPWLLVRVIEGCGGHPGPHLRNWLAGRGVGDDEIAETAKQVRGNSRADVAAWEDPSVVRRAAKSLEVHPLARVLGKMLYTAVSMHAPENLGWVSPQFHPETSMLRITHEAAD